MIATVALLAAAPLGAGFVASVAQPDEVDPALRARLADGEATDAFVTYDHRPTAADAARLAGLGLTVHRVYADFQVAYVAGLPTQLLGAVRLPGIVWLQGNDELQYHGNTGAVATRARESWDAKSTSTTPVTVGGVVVDGTGATVAVVDSGVDGTHPDLAPAMLQNVKYLCTTPGLVSTATDTCYGNALIWSGCAVTGNGWSPQANTDTSSGHGTHVAGIVAGRGVASGGRIMGNAPGAGIVGVGVGEGLSILYAVEAFQWVLCNQATYGIDIVQNSWGGTGAFVASDPVNMAVDDLVNAGMTVVFSAGNDGSAATNQVNRYAKNPLDGVIGVGSSFDNEQARSTTATVSTYSSTCLATGTADDCPDIGAPGEWISSAQGKTGPAVLALGAGGELNHLPYYSSISGTSMAAPAISGVLALLEQAKAGSGGISPAASELLLKDTAVDMPALSFPVTDGDCTATGGKNTALGCGHVDAIAALESALSSTGLGSPLPQLAQNPHVYVGAPGVGGADAQFVSGVQWTVPAGHSVTLSERTIDGESTVSVGQACRFVVIPVAPSGAPVTVPCTAAGAGLAADPLPGPPYRMDAAYTFPAAGSYVVEPQILFGATYRAFDHFQVTAL